MNKEIKYKFEVGCSYIEYRHAPLKDKDKVNVLKASCIAKTKCFVTFEIPYSGRICKQRIRKRCDILDYDNQIYTESAGGIYAVHKCED